MTNIITFPKNDFTVTTDVMFNEILGEWNELEATYMLFLTKHAMWNKEIESAEIQVKRAESVYEKIKAHERIIYISRQKAALFTEYNSKKLEPGLKVIEKYLDKIKNQKVDILV
jgi:agmatine/peptidylarginine deiminase